ncbi:MAG TPA: SIMPL domain-containing protein [Bradyrhizobium sp.]|nr:SIMPL domain-containing protein [Bradyrhizobium sp.]
MTKPLFLLASAFASLALIAVPASAQTPPPAISVSGEANVSVAPDLAQVEGGVTSEAKTAREASDANNAAMGKVLLAVKGAGIDEKDYQTSRLSLQPQYTQSGPSRAGPPQISGYRASNRVIIKVRDITKVANVIDTLVGAGANEIGGINFIVTQASRALDEARTKAVADARRKAEIYAKATGVTLGEPLNITEEGAAPPPVFRSKVAAPMASNAPAPVAPGEELLSITVNVTWAIKAQ